MSDATTARLTERFRRAVLLQGTGIVVPFIVEDCRIALERMGCFVFELGVRWLARESFESITGELRKCIGEIKPDFILSLDGGLVRDYPAFFAELGIPVVEWFVDDPTLVITAENIFDNMLLFTWDREFIEPIRSLGCRVVEYLPLGVNPQKFRRVPPDDPRLAEYKCGISFVGSSLAEFCEKDVIKKELDPRVSAVFEECIRRHAAPPHPPLHDLLGEIEERENINILAQNRVLLEEDLSFQAVIAYRCGAVNRLARFEPHVYGDGGWSSLLSQGPVYKGSIDYKTELNLLYSASQINLNLSKMQLKTSVNQRVFDAPACGGFVLTDYREDAVRLFDPETEIAVFRDLDEMEAKAAYFLENKAEREMRARKSKQRVLNEHTYVHRMKRMLEVMDQNL